MWWFSHEQLSHPIINPSVTSVLFLLVSSYWRITARTQTATTSLWRSWNSYDRWVDDVKLLCRRVFRTSDLWCDVAPQSAVNVTRDFEGCSTLRKYFGQLHYLQSRVPLGPGQDAAVPVSWSDFSSLWFSEQKSNSFLVRVIWCRSVHTVINQMIQSHCAVMDTSAHGVSRLEWPVFSPSSPGRKSSRGRRLHTTTSATSKRASCITWVSVCTVPEPHRIYCVHLKSLCLLMRNLYIFVFCSCRSAAFDAGSDGQPSIGGGKCSLTSSLSFSHRSAFSNFCFCSAILHVIFLIYITDMTHGLLAHMRSDLKCSKLPLSFGSIVNLLLVLLPEQKIKMTPFCFL